MSRSELVQAVLDAESAYAAAASAGDRNSNLIAD